MRTGSLSPLRQLAYEYAEQSIDRDTYLIRRGQLLDQLSGELPGEEEWDKTVEVPAVSAQSAKPPMITRAQHVAEPGPPIQEEQPPANQKIIFSESSKAIESKTNSPKPSTIQSSNEHRAKRSGGPHRALVMAFWVVLGLGGVTIYMIASGMIL